MLLGVSGPGPGIASDGAVWVLVALAVVGLLLYLWARHRIRRGGDGHD